MAFHPRSIIHDSPSRGTGARPGGYVVGDAQFAHYLEGDVLEYFNHPNVGAGGKTFWPPGTTDADVARYLQEAIDTLHTPEYQFVRPTPHNPRTVFLPSGTGVRVGVLGRWRDALQRR